MRCPTLTELPTTPLRKTGWPWTAQSPQMADTMSDGSSWPKISIITPSFNQGRFIEETIRSVLLQGYPNVEYIVIDGGSTDESVDIIRKYSPWLAYWCSEPDKGQADAINKGFEKSTGQFLAWINSDDYFYPDFMHRMIRNFQAKPEVDFLYGDVHMGGDTHGKKLIRYGESLPFKEMLRSLRIRIPQQATMWRRSVIDKVGPLDLRWHVVLDRDFFVRVGLNCKMEYVSGVMAFFRRHKRSKSISEKSRWLSEVPIMYQEFCQRRDLPKEVLALKNETMGAAYLFCAKYASDCDSLFVHCKYLLKTGKEYPRLLFRSNFWSFLVGKTIPTMRRHIRKRISPIKA